jgi:copper homeostasis protein (lipoprotein)
MKKNRPKKSYGTINDNIISPLVFIIIALLLVGTVIYIQSNKTKSTTQNNIIVAAKPVSQTFAGTLPCADCSGLQTELILTQTIPNAWHGTFKMKQIYEGKSVNPLLTTGTWEMSQGSPSDSQAKILELKTETEQPEYWLVVDNNTIQMLDSQKNTINSPFNNVLKSLQQ